MTEQPNLPNSYVYPKKGETHVEHYEFEPIKGYPMLQWKGKRPFTSTQFYPAQLREVYGEPVDGWRNMLFWGDNLQVMSHLLKEFRGKVDLVYIDPPFDSKADYKKKITIRGTQIINDHTSFEDKQYSDIWTNDEYLQFMFDRLILIRELLSPNGSIFLHCDWRMNSYLRLIMDEIFGKNCFRNEIIWHYQTYQGQGSSYFPRKHDTILYFSKGNSPYFKLLKDVDPTKTIDFTRWNAYLNENNEITGANYPATDSRFDGYIRKFIKENHRKPGPNDVILRIVGNTIDSVWDIKAVDPKNLEEKTNYPTQKPEVLLERIISASTRPGDLVFDCFMGSGTTQAVALKLGRRFIGADINLGAIKTTTTRLLNVVQEIKEKHSQHQLSGEESVTYYTGFEVYNVNHYDVFRNPVEARDLLLEALEVQRLEAGHLFDGEKDGRMIKIMPVNRIATRADLSELIAGFDYKSFDRRQAQNPGKPVEKITLVCMGHEPDLAAHLKNEVLPYIIDVEVVDILRDKQDLQFKRDSEAKVVVKNGLLVIEAFYPMNLLQKLSMQKENVTDWRELVESIMVDWNYDGAVLQPAVVDIPERNDLVKGNYPVPKDAGTIRVKITDLLSESLEVEVKHG